jgi:phage shock protein A
MDRFDLIARKQEVRRQIERLNRQLDAERSAAARAAADPKRDRRRIAQIEQQLQTLMAEEYSLRLAIDRSG